MPAQLAGAIPQTPSYQAVDQDDTNTPPMSYQQLNQMITAYGQEPGYGGGTPQGAAQSAPQQAPIPANPLPQAGQVQQGANPLSQGQLTQLMQQYGPETSQQPATAPSPSGTPTVGPQAPSTPQTAQYAPRSATGQGKTMNPMLAESMGMKLPTGAVGGPVYKPGAAPQAQGQLGAAMEDTGSARVSSIQQKQSLNAFSSAFSTNNDTSNMGKYLKDNPTTLTTLGIPPSAQGQFLGQMAHESNNFKNMTEMISDTQANKQYGPDTKVGKNLGNTSPGDGAKYKGRGMIQLTGKYNYKKYGDLIGVDLVSNPELAADPTNALKIATAYWNDNNLNSKAGDTTAVTKAINGGTNGLDSRNAYVKQYSQ